MKKFNIILTTAIVLLMAACQPPVDDRLTELDKLKKEKTAITDKIKTLEAELVEEGLLEKGGSVAIVAVQGVKKMPFQHKVEMRAGVASKKNVLMTAETNGKVASILAKEGQKVSKGQLLVSLDASIIRSGIKEVESQLALAEEVFQRQDRLWKKKIGTEVQYLQAKSNKESLQHRLSSLKSQLDMARVKAPFSGVVDDIPVNVGEVLYPGVPVIRLVSQDDYYLMAAVSEALLGKFEKGDVVDIYFPSQDKRLTSTINSVGQVINPENRTFEIEINLPKLDFPVKPNQVAVLNLEDYSNGDAYVVPQEVIQRDSKGYFVYSVVKQEGETVAKKIPVEVGMTYENATEIMSGLKEGQKLIVKGYREVSEGSMVDVKG